MTMTDPIADMLTRIRNANVAMHDTVRMPSSEAQGGAGRRPVAGGLHRGLRAFTTTPGRPGRTLEITMKYTPDRQPDDLRGCAGCPSPACACTPAADKLPRVLGGLGVAVLSTSQGLMTDREARQRRVGGEVLCYVW